MLWACLHFPDFSLQLLLRGAALSSSAIITTGGNRPEVLSSNLTARSHGVAPGMTVSAAIALAPDLIERPRDPAGEMKALEGTAAWAGQFTSMVSLAPPDALLLEIEGSLRLCGGLRQLLLRLGQDLAELGYTPAIAVAPTPAAARLLARAGVGATITDIAALETALAGLPLCLLDQPEDITRMLALMGVRTLGECLTLPRDGLARRFGQPLLDELDRALGRLADPRPAWIAPSRYRAQLALPAPVQDTEPLLFAANRLIQELTGWLRMKQAGITRLKLVLLHEERRPTLVTLGFSMPSRDPRRILVLLRERLSTLTLPDRVEAIILDSMETRPLGSRNLCLFPEDRLPEEERWLIIEHLRARLGSEAVYSIASHSDHRPELAWRCCEPGTATAGDEHAKRPVWLLDPPQRLRSEGDQPVLKEPLTLLAGPERIESGWWDEKDVGRDYFVARDAAGAAFWVFRERGANKTWFLQGMFA
jgi:protein ImuB